MERLTNKESASYDLIKMNNEWCIDYCKGQPVQTCRDCAIHEAIQKLAYYEDLEEQGYLKISQCISQCPPSSTVYVLSTCNKVPSKLDGGFWDATGYYCPYEDFDNCPFVNCGDCHSAKGKIGIFEDELTGYSLSIYDNEERWIILLNNVCDNFTLEDFGKRIFLTREEAQLALDKMEQSLLSHRKESKQ